MTAIPRAFRLAPLLALLTLGGCDRAPSSTKAAAMVSDSAAALLAKGETLRSVEVFGRAIALDSTLVNAYRGRAIAQKDLNHYELALADYNKAILLDTTSAATYNNRGFTLQLMGDYERSIQDFNHAVVLNPQLTAAYRNRARSQFFLGHFLEASADFRAGPYVPSANAYGPLWSYIASQRIGGADTLELTTQLTAIDLNVWPGAVAKFYLGRISEKELMAAAADPDTLLQRNRQCAASYYLGEYLLWQKPPRVAESKSRFREATENCPSTLIESIAAKADLGRGH